MIHVCGIKGRAGEVCIDTAACDPFPAMRCNRCHRPMLGTTAYDGACACGGLIEAHEEVKPIDGDCYDDSREENYAHGID